MYAVPSLSAIKSHPESCRPCRQTWRCCWSVASALRTPRGLTLLLHALRCSVLSHLHAAGRHTSADAQYSCRGRPSMRWSARYRVSGRNAARNVSKIRRAHKRGHAGVGVMVTHTHSHAHTRILANTRTHTRTHTSLVCVVMVSSYPSNHQGRTSLTGATLLSGPGWPDGDTAALAVDNHHLAQRSQLTTRDRIAVGTNPEPHHHHLPP